MIALATYRGGPALSDDDRLLHDALEARSLTAEARAWNDPTADWTRYDAVILRSCWDYHRQLPAFLQWIAHLEQRGVALWNEPDVVRWNVDKRYLRDLASAGVRIVPTIFVEPSDERSLRSILGDVGWDRVVVKPAVSASAHETWTLSAADAAGAEARFGEARRTGTQLVQPFLHQVVEDGEWSLVFIAGRYSHAALKWPRTGDFRVQAEHGGSAERREPDRAVIEAATFALRAHHAVRETLYARVDGCLVDGAFVLMELELVEPWLYFGLSAEATGRLAAEVTRRLAS
jgi:glutathione synthase/RimK-type ligase-like ATP-grasp enzyme